MGTKLHTKKIRKKESKVKSEKGNRLEKSPFLRLQNPKKESFFSCEIQIFFRGAADSESQIVAFMLSLSLSLTHNSTL